MLEYDQSELSAAVEPAVSRTAVIAFGPDQIVRAICFHMLDDNHASSVSALSVHHTRDRLRRQKIRLMIVRRQWEGMGNRERLEWLLGQSRTQTVFSGDVASLVLQKQ